MEGGKRSRGRYKLLADEKLTNLARKSDFCNLAKNSEESLATVTLERHFGKRGTDLREHLDELFPYDVTKKRKLTDAEMLDALEQQQQ